MKLLLFCFCLLFQCCTNKNLPDTISKKAIIEYMKRNISDPAKYKPLGFGPIKSDSSEFRYDPGYKMLRDSAEKYGAMMRGIPERSHEFEDRMFAFYDSLSFFEQHYQRHPVGFARMHVYSQQNGSGETTIDSIYFKLDSAYHLRDIGYAVYLMRGGK